MGLADIFAYLYGKYLRVDPANPNDPNRDRLILSNGHVCAVRYAAMGLAGYFQGHDLLSFRKLGSPFQGHPSTKYLPELENSSGSLGQGLSNATGLALGLKLQGNHAKVIAALSDGECQEGMTWEAAMAAAHHKAENLTAFIDGNNIQIDGYVKDVMNVGELADKFASFGWEVKTADGHDMAAIEEAFLWSEQKNSKPKLIYFNTTLGKGVSYMENQPGWHGVAPNEEQRNQAHQELIELA
jgi:transketolase